MILGPWNQQIGLEEGSAVSINKLESASSKVYKILENMSCKKFGSYTPLQFIVLQDRNSQQTITQKMAEQVWFDFYVDFTMSLCAL